MQLSKEFKGETLGTFLLVLFGCGSVAVSVLFNAYQGLMQIALAWGLGVTLSIYLTRHLSCAQLNPAVTLAMVISKRMAWRKMPVYMAAQFTGAFMAGLTVSSIICLIAPLTQAGLNPARDFGPRMVAWLTGWGNAAFPDQSGGFWLVYILGPLAGATVAALFFIHALEPAMGQPSQKYDCKNKEK